MTEIWRPVPGRDGYEVSSLGRVRSIDRVVAKRSRSGRIVLARLRGRVLRLNMAGSDYLFVSFSRGRAYVHHLVLEAFVGPRPAGHQAAHGDGNPLNNALANLRWATAKENEADKRLHGTVPVGTKSAQGRKTQCPRGHPYNEQNTHRANGRRYCRICRRDQTRRYRGTPPSRWREPVQPRLREAHE